MFHVLAVTPSSLPLLSSPLLPSPLLPSFPLLSPPSLSVEEWVQCLFVDLKLSTPNPARISYDTLCQLDMEATLLLLLNHCLEEVGSMVEKSRTEGGAQQIATLLCTVFLASVTVKEDLARFWHNALRLHAGTARCDRKGG